LDVLLINAGSSSLKFSLMRDDATVRASGMADWSGATTRYQFADRPPETVPWRSPGPAVRHAIDDLTRFGMKPAELLGVGHRWVHGGDFTESVRITPEVRAKLAALADLAPLHNPPSLGALDAALEALPNVPHVAAFDTAFHATIPPEARTYAIPRQWTAEWGLRRYGFHGLSYAYCATRAAEMLGRDDLRLIACHLGQGCSAAAIRAGRCVDTTMGFTPLEGLMMATRSGSIDPSIVTHVQQRHGLTAAQVEEALNKQSGLLGVSGVSGDMRAVHAAADARDANAKLALAVYVHRLRQAIGALAASLGGVDALIFTGGVGEHDAHIRAETCAGLEFLGVRLDDKLNSSSHPDADITHNDSRVRILVLTAREDLTLLNEVRHVVACSW
jgi:acetate kinase